jgi:hypothetical protein
MYMTLSELLGDLAQDVNEHGDDENWQERESAARE